MTSAARQPREQWSVTWMVSGVRPADGWRPLRVSNTEEMPTARCEASDPDPLRRLKPERRAHFAAHRPRSDEQDEGLTGYQRDDQIGEPLSGMFERT